MKSQKREPQKRRQLLSFDGLTVEEVCRQLYAHAGYEPPLPRRNGSDAPLASPPMLAPGRPPESKACYFKLPARKRNALLERRAAAAEGSSLF